LLLEGHGLSAYSQGSSRRRLLHMQTQQRDTHSRVLFCLSRAQRPLTISELLPEIMPVKTELDYAVSTGIGERRCYAEACIQTHLLWLIEEGKVQRMKERNQVRFLSNVRPDGEQE
jgi:hydroxyacylglutathione hydrolase